MSPILSKLDVLDKKLVRAGFPPMSQFWRETFTKLYSGAQRSLVARCGRRAGKSSSLCRIAVLEALYGEHKIPPGDVGVVAFISANRDEAASRLRTIEAILKALNVPHVRGKDEVRLEGPFKTRRTR